MWTEIQRVAHRVLAGQDLKNPAAQPVNVFNACLQDLVVSAAQVALFLTHGQNWSLGRGPRTIIHGRGPTRDRLDQLHKRREGAQCAKAGP